MEPTTHPPTLRLSATVDGQPAVNREFTSAFRIGRGDDCDVCIKHQYVSRHHVEIQYAGGQWWVRDLQSSNGTYLNDKKAEQFAVGKNTQFRLGIAGPEIRLETQPSEVEGDRTILERYVKHYFEKPAGAETVGEHTMFMRRAAAAVQQKQSRKYQWLLGACAAVAIAAGTYTLHVRNELVEQRSAAKDLFYSIKALDVHIGTLEKIVQSSAYQSVGAAEIEKQQSQRRELEQNYDRFLATLKVYDPKLTPKQKLIMRVTRIFGECELNMPKGYEAEVERYIKRWQDDDRMQKAMRLARAKGYPKRISDELLAQGLPRQFFYLALQESLFDEYASGPPTAKGIAKGMWQFIPETALKYGLHLGPLVDTPAPDTGDDRHHFDRETRAAVRYLKDLYCTDAQASGLLVMACYNWGEGRVLPLVQEMPANPRERNFWQLLARHKDRLPQETYDYVFYIVSAAVIGEDPHMFGFDFDNPLAAR